MSSNSELIQIGTQELQSSSGTARLDAELLLAHSNACSREKVLAHSSDSVRPEVEKQFYDLIKRRKAGEPVAYLLGKREFWSLQFEVNRDVLIPRPETEILVEHALKFVLGRREPLRILDLGTGSGCIAIALGHELRRAGREFEIIATDISPAALALAQKNCRTHELESSIHFKRSDFFGALDFADKFELIVSNPPYVAEQDSNVSPEIAFEPKQALFAPENGFAAVQHLINVVPSLLKSQAAFFCEIGANQGILALKTANEFWPSARSRILPDLAGLPRVLCIENP